MLDWLAVYLINGLTDYLAAGPWDLLLLDLLQGKGQYWHHPAVADRAQQVGRAGAVERGRRGGARSRLTETSSTFSLALLFSEIKVSLVPQVYFEICSSNTQTLTRTHTHTHWIIVIVIQYNKVNNIQSIKDMSAYSPRDGLYTN